MVQLSGQFKTEVDKALSEFGLRMDWRICLVEICLPDILYEGSKYDLAVKLVNDALPRNIIYVPTRYPNFWATEEYVLEILKQYFSGEDCPSPSCVIALNSKGRLDYLEECGFILRRKVICPK